MRRFRRGDAAPEPEPEDVEAELTAEEVRGRAAVGAVIVAGRGLIIRAIGLGGNIALARVLAPRDFGLLAIGLSITWAVTFLSDAGVGAGFVRAAKAPVRADLRALSGLQVTITVIGAAVCLLVTFAFASRRVAEVTALMAVALPFNALLSPGRVMLERQLEYSLIAAVEITEVVAFYVWAMSALALGLGVWGVAISSLPSALAGLVVMARVAPKSVLLPGFRFGRMRGILKFGAQFQAVQVTNLARDQAINIGTGAIGGVAMLGLWSLASRVMQVPFLLFTTLWRVTFPAMSRLVALGENPRPVIERTARLGAFATGLILAPLSGSALLLVPAVFGERWADVGPLIPIIAIGLQIGGPLSVACGGYLFAVGDARTVLIAAVAHSLVWVTIALSLIPVIGVTAVALGWMLCSPVDGTIMARSASRHSGARFGPALIPPLIAAYVTGAAGVALSTRLPHSLLAGLGVALLVAAAYLAVLWVTERGLLRDAHEVADRQFIAKIRERFGARSTIGVG